MKLLKFLILFVLTILLSGCEKYTVTPGEDRIDEREAYTKAAKVNSPSEGMQFKATGFVEIVWKGGEKGSDMGNKPEELLTFLELSALKKNANSEAIGEITYLVLGTDRSPHRQITAKVSEIQVAGSKACIIGRVVYDSKGCVGNGSGGHDSGCGDDGGCSDDHTGDDGGCSDDHSGDDGGCSDDHSGDDGGCSDGTDHGGMGGPAGNKGNPLSGKNCRIDQMIALKVHDLGTPGTNGDKISWKWFSQETVPSLVELMYTKPDPGAIHLCKKTIIGGNLVVHE